MNSKTTAATLFLFIFFNFLFCSCSGPKLLPHPVEVKVFSMKLPATDFIYIDTVFKNDSDLVQFSFKKTLFKRYRAEGKLFPATSTEKVRFKKTNSSSIPNIYFRGLVLTKDSIDTFIKRLKNSSDNIDLMANASDYEIIFQVTGVKDPGDDYVNFDIYAQKTGSATKSLSTSRTRPNPCPPCTY